MIVDFSKLVTTRTSLQSDIRRGKSECPACSNPQGTQACVACGQTIKPSREELIETLRSVLKTIENSDAWWIDDPVCNGFDVERIKRALGEAL